MLDIVFCSVPFSNLNNIYSAPAILKGVSISNGYTAQTVYFWLDLFNQCNRDPDYFNEVQIYFIKSVDNHFIHYDKNVVDDLELYHQNLALYENT